MHHRHQFPSTPQRTTIPSWQRSGDQSSTKSNSPPPVSTEATNGNISSSSPPPPLLSGEPVTNGDSSSADPAQTPVKEPITENGAEDAVQKGPSPTPDEHVNGSVKPIESQATPTLEGTAWGWKWLHQDPFRPKAKNCLKNHCGDFFKKCIGKIVLFTWQVTHRSWRGCCVILATHI